MRFTIKDVVHFCLIACVPASLFFLFLDYPSAAFVSGLWPGEIEILNYKSLFRVHNTRLARQTASIVVTWKQLNVLVPANAG